MNTTEIIAKMAVDATALATPTMTEAGPIPELVTEADREWFHATIDLIERKLATLRTWYPLDGKEVRIGNDWHRKVQP